MISFPRSKFSRSLVQKKNFSLIGQVSFKLEYLFCQGKKDSFFEFEWTWLKVLKYLYHSSNLKSMFTWHVPAFHILLINSIKYFLFEVWFFHTLEKIGRQKQRDNHFRLSFMLVCMLLSCHVRVSEWNYSF